MILKLGLYNEVYGIGKRFHTIDNVADLRTGYVKVPVKRISDGDGESPEFVFDWLGSANMAIHDHNMEFDFSKNPKKCFLKLQFRFRESGLDTNMIIYTDKEVYVCNDEGQTIDKFREQI